MLKTIYSALKKLNNIQQKIIFLPIINIEQTLHFVKKKLAYFVFQVGLYNSLPSPTYQLEFFDGLKSGITYWVIRCSFQGLSVEVLFEEFPS